MLAPQSGNKDKEGSRTKTQQTSVISWFKDTRNEFPLTGGGSCPLSNEAAVALLHRPSHRELAEARAPFYQVPFVPFALVPLHDSTSTSIGLNCDHVTPPPLLVAPFTNGLSPGTQSLPPLSHFHSCLFPLDFHPEENGSVCLKGTTLWHFVWKHSLIVYMTVYVLIFLCTYLRNNNANDLFTAKSNI
ncbi:hypothetical protein GOODEAATRI_010720 [Goodea atripinnis]|uniref:Uncharacterized protein n=1 Tax=Goodea atripinnis TaxID=208336 RepID=A0ABV0NW17_9TELE